MWRKRAWTTIIVAVIGLSGCQNNSSPVDVSSGAPRQAQSIPELIAQGQPPIPDFPVPMGFKLIENKSRDYALPGARFVDHVYKGSKNKITVKRFYERQMPINRWTLATAMFVRGDIVMDFEKETERCRLNITDGGLFGPTYIKVQLWTSGRVQSPSGR